MPSGTFMILIEPWSSSLTTNDLPSWCSRSRIRRVRPRPSMRRSPGGPSPRQEQGRDHHKRQPGKPKRIAAKDIGEPVDSEVEARRANHRSYEGGADGHEQAAVRRQPYDEDHGQHSVEGDGLRGMPGGKCPAFIGPTDLEGGRWPGATDGRLD